MKNFGTLFRGGLLRSRRALVLILIVSVGVIFISSLAVTLSSGGADDDKDEVKETQHVRIGFIDRDGSAAVRDMASYFEDTLGIGLVRSDDRGELDSELVNKRISGIAEIPEGFQRDLLEGSPKPVELTFLDDYTNEAFIRGYFISYTDSLSVLATASGADAGVFENMLAETDRRQSDVVTESKDTELARQEADKEGYSFMLGFFMMFSFMMSIIISQMLHTDKLDGTFRRIRASSATSLEYVASVAGIGFVISLIIEGPAMLIWHVSGSYSIVPPGMTFLMLFAFATLVNAVSIFVGIAMPSFSGIIAVIIAVSTITSMLGGAWFPMDIAPPVFQAISKFTPQYWMYEIVGHYEDGSGSVGVPMAIILLAALLFLILSGIMFSSKRSDMRALAR
ncbi:MAG: ABC transporter permease [Clostridiales Family XIII bacterium]|nr:ABC transporter permease [Clostridiales Family XIII bacterium]